MEDQEQEPSSRPSQSSEAEPRTEPVRSRWTPKPEQILILESIFNSGMVNPPKDETVRIRRLLEKFGAVGDANVFYWFQNRRSRSRRRQRQIQASLSTAASGREPPPTLLPRGGAIQYESTASGDFGINPGSGSAYNPGSNCLIGSGSGFELGGNNAAPPEDFFGFSGHTAGIQEIEQNSIFAPSDSSSLRNYHPGVITVFINGVATEVGRGPFDMKAMFGDFVLFHSSGVPVEVNEYGFLVQSLQHGESYFLVPRHS